MKILIAEDDRYIGEGLFAIVEAEGYAPTLVADGSSRWPLPPFRLRRRRWPPVAPVGTA